jgi:hypothetical protein
MSYSNLIDTNITLAFKMLKDLAVDATIYRRAVTEFDFGTGVTDLSTTTIPVKVIVINSEKKSQEHNTLINQIMLRSKEVLDVTALDKITINGVSWRFSNILKSNGYIIVAAIAREV